MKKASLKLTRNEGKFLQIKFRSIKKGSLPKKTAFNFINKYLASR